MSTLKFSREHGLQLQREEPDTVHVAIGKMGMSDGSVHEIITVDRAFIITALTDAAALARSRPETASGVLAEYEAALEVVQPPHG